MNFNYEYYEYSNYEYMNFNFPKAGRIGKSFLVLLGCPSGRYYLGTTVFSRAAPILKSEKTLGTRLVEIMT